MLSKVKLLSMFTQCLPNYFSSFTQPQYLPNKSSTIYQETIHTPISSQHMLNILPSQYWPKFVQSLAKLRGWFMIEKCLISSLWHWDILMSVEVTVYGISGLGLGGQTYTNCGAICCCMGLPSASQVEPPRQAPDGTTMLYTRPLKQI